VKLTTHLHLVPRSKNEWSYTSSTPPIRLHGVTVKHRDNFTFLLSLLGITIRDRLLNEDLRLQNTNIKTKDSVQTEENEDPTDASEGEKQEDVEV